MNEVIQTILYICSFLLGFGIGFVSSFKKLVAVIPCFMIIDLRNGINWMSLYFWTGMILGILGNDELKEKEKK